MFLHCDMGIEVVEGAVCLVAVGEGAMVETLYFVVASARPLLDDVSGKRDKGVGLSRGIEVMGHVSGIGKGCRTVEGARGIGDRGRIRIGYATTVVVVVGGIYGRRGVGEIGMVALGGEHCKRISRVLFREREHWPGRGWTQETQIKIRDRLMLIYALSPFAADHVQI
jgi:hypothetical protein